VRNKYREWVDRMIIADKERFKDVAGLYPSDEQRCPTWCEWFLIAACVGLAACALYL